jgi:hypothetical protein
VTIGLSTVMVDRRGPARGALRVPGWARNCGTGGQTPDLLLPGLVATGVPAPDGTTQLAPEDEDFRTTYRRTPGVVQRRFGLSLDPAYLNDAPLPAYAVRSVSSGSPCASPVASPTSAVNASVRIARPVPSRSNVGVNGPSGP